MVDTAAVRLGSRPLLLALALAAVFGLLELPFASFMADDLIQLSVLEGVSPDRWTGPLELYTISDGEPVHVQAMKDAGAFPWFFDPGFEMAFFRPLSSGLLALDHTLFGLQPLGYRVHGTLWFLLLMLGLGLLLRTAVPGPVGRLALILFAISGIHGILCWTATRHIVIAGALGVLALAAHVHGRQGGWRPGRALAVVGLALALTAGEAAVAVMAYLFAYEAISAPGSRRERLLAALPTAVLLLAYLGLYAALGYGSSTASGYLDPLRDPLGFLVELPPRLTFLLGAMVTGGNADIWVLRPDLHWAMVIFGACSLAVGGGLLWASWKGSPPDQRHGARWLFLGAAASALPFTGSPMGSRCLVVPLMGGSVAIAWVLHRWWTVGRRRSGVAPRANSGACWVLAVIHLAVAPLQRLAAPPLFQAMMSTSLATAMDEAELGTMGLQDQTVVVLNAPSLVVGFHAWFYRALEGLPLPRDWRTLSWAPGTHRFHRTAADTLELELEGAGMSAPNLNVGDIIEIRGLRAAVLERGRIGPSRVEFQFDLALEDPAIHLLAWREGRLQRQAAPPIGETITLDRLAP